MLQKMGIYPNACYNYLIMQKPDIRLKSSMKTGGILGQRSTRVFLERKGMRLSKTTVYKYMNQKLGLLSTYRRKSLGHRKGHAHKIFTNLSNGTFRYNCSIINLYHIISFYNFILNNL